MAALVAAGEGNGPIPAVGGYGADAGRAGASRARGMGQAFDETAAALRFSFQGAEVTEAEILDMLSNPDAAKRSEAGKSLSSTLKANERLLSLILNTIAKDKEVEDRWRGFARPVASRNLANDVDDEVVDALVGAVTGRFGDLTHRYYALKAGWMGRDQIDWWDRNAPLPGDDDRVLYGTRRSASFLMLCRI